MSVETHVGTRGVLISQETKTQTLITAKYLDSSTGAVMVQIQFVFLFIRGTRVISPELYMYM